jgi:general secretion pathway protein G
MMVERSHRSEMRDEIRGGFTLMEVMVVVAIIVLLAAAAAPLVFNRLAEARVSRAKVDCDTWTGAVMSYKIRYGDFPPSLQALTVVQADGNGAYMEPKHLMDPWGHEYQYAPQGPHNSPYGKPDIWSLGPSVSNAAGIVGNWQ